MRPKARPVRRVLWLAAVALVAVVARGLVYDGAGRDELARRAGCADKLRQVYEAMLRYNRDHGGKWPASLESLQGGGYVPDASVLRCSSPGALPYVYLQPSRSVSPDSVLVYDPNHRRTIRGQPGVKPVVIVLFGAGRVVLLAPGQFDNAVTDSAGPAPNGQSGAQAPEGSISPSEGDR